MNTSKSYPDRRLLVIVIVLLAVGLACTCNGLTGIVLPATATPAPPPAGAQEPSMPAPLAAPELEAAGPWLLISTDNGLWAADRDGTHLGQLTQGEFWQNDLNAAIQPNGNQVVLLTSGEDRYHHLALNLLSLPDGRTQKITDLTTPETEPGLGAAPGDASLEAVRAIVEQPAFAWSPDGTKLAFIGVLDGPTAEVYLYDTTTQEITRVSNDDAQNFWPSWSPDGKYLLYFGAEVFGTGAGITMKGAWVAKGDGSNVTMLYETSSSGEELVGWRDDQTAVLASWNPVCGSGELRLYNIVNTRRTSIHEGCFNSAAVGRFLETSSGAVMFGTEEGVSLLPGDGDQPVKLSDRQATSIKWNQEGIMFVVKYNDGSMTTFYSADVSTTEEAPAKVQDVTMFGIIWAWTNAEGDLPGVWISGPGMNIGQISDQPAYAPIWDQKDNTLWFFSRSENGTDLYKATFASYSDAAVVAHLDGTVQEVAWVGQFTW